MGGVGSHLRLKNLFQPPQVFGRIYFLAVAFMEAGFFKDSKVQSDSRVSLPASRDSYIR